MFFPEVSLEDVSAEMALRKLLGIEAKRENIEMEFKRQILPILEDGDDAIGLDYAFSVPPKPTFEQIERITDWAWEHGGRNGDAAKIIDWFFDNPEYVTETIEKLKQLELINPDYAEKAPDYTPQKVNYMALLRRQFQKLGTIDRDYLDELAYREFITQQEPIAYLNVLLTNLEDVGEVEYIGGDYGEYRWLGQ